MAMSSSSKMLQMQMQIRENATELNDYLRDLDSWENDIKNQDKTFTKMKPKQEKQLSTPIRGSSTTKKKKFDDKVESEKPKRIKSYDFKSWDKLDVDQMLDDIDAKEEDDEAREQEKVEKNLQKLSLDEKVKGNDHFKAARYEKSIECYTKGMQYDANNAVLPANRAMAYLKLKRYVESEADCTLSLSLDPAYVKAYLRRGAARNALGKVESAVRDFNDALKLEPDNKQAKQELNNIKKQTKPTTNEIGDSFLKSVKKKSGLIMPINKPPHLQSKKPLKRIHVEEVGQVKLERRADFGNDPITSPSVLASSEIFQSGLKSENGDCKPNPLIMEINDEQQPSKPTLSNHQDPKRNTEVETTKISNTKSTVSAKLSNGDSLMSPASVSIEEPRVPPTPSTCFQFQADVRKLEKDTGVLFQYLSQLDPSTIPNLLKDQLDTDLLLSVINCFEKYLTSNPQFVVEFLRNLSLAKRFDMAVLFLSNKDKKVLESLCQQLVAHHSEEKENIRKLFKLYGFTALGSSANLT